MKRATWCIALLLGTTALSSQETPRPTFEVATVRPSASDGTAGGIKPGPDGITAQGASLFLLLRVAYNLQDYQIVGPAWLRDARYDIVAKASGPVRDQNMLRQMLQSLLADRFKVVIRREQRPQPAYALVVADGGPKLRQAEGKGPGGTSASPGRLVITAATMPALAMRLSQILDRPVVDTTGLIGAYDFTLEWQQDGDTIGPSLFTAVQEQLGLKLESRGVPIDVLVVERAERIASQN